MANSKKMNDDEFELLLGFVMREHRMLKNRETSFTPDQLADGEAKIKHVLKTVKAFIKKNETVEDYLSKPAKSAALVSEASAKNKKVAKALVKTIVENYRLFDQVMHKSNEPKVILPDLTKGDKFYVPKQHHYR